MTNRLDQVVLRAVPVGSGHGYDNWVTKTSQWERHHSLGSGSWMGLSQKRVRQALDGGINPLLFAGHYGRDVTIPSSFCHCDLPATNDCNLQLWDRSPLSWDILL